MKQCINCCTTDADLCVAPEPPVATRQTITHIHYPRRQFEGVSVITACMNRNANLAIAIRTWLSISEIREIIVVDWSSTEPVLDTLKRHLRDIPRWSEKVKLIRVEGQTKWVLSWAYNLAARHATRPWLLKLDCDNTLEKYFIQSHLRIATETESVAETTSEFFTGDWQKARNRNELHLNGVLLTPRHSFLAIGGYNEFIQSYGWDDSDLYLRLETSLHMRRVAIDNNTISHIEHDDVARSTKNTFRDIHFNRFLSQKLSWDLSRMGCRYSITDVSEDQGNDVQWWFQKARLVSHPVISAACSEWALAELEKFIAIKMKMPQDLANNSKRFIYAHVRNGLGNRARALASVYSLFDGLNKSEVYNADKKNWHLVIVWDRSFHCEAELGDLFDLSSLSKEYPSQISIITELPTRSMLSQPLYELAANNNLDEYTVKNGIVVATMDKLLEAVGEQVRKGEPASILLESTSVIQSPFGDWHKDCAFLRKLQVVPEVQHLIDETIRKMGGKDLSKMVGVHIRLGQGDQPFDDVSGWSLKQQETWYHWRDKSSVPTFVAKMQELRDQEPDLCFFLASDSGRVYDEVKEHFPPDTIFTQHRSVFDRSLEQVRTGLGDTILLGRCKMLLCSNWSSFSEMVIRFSAIPKLVSGVDF